MSGQYVDYHLMAFQVFAIQMRLNKLITLYGYFLCMVIINKGKCKVFPFFYNRQVPQSF